MFPSIRLLIATVALLAANSRAGCEPVPPAAADGVLLLRSGSVLRGTITRSQTHYHVVRPHGEIHIGVAEVEAYCRDLDEAYRFKLAAVRAGLADDHLELAEWCLRQEIWERAAEQIAAARDADAAHPKVLLLARRLQLARQGSTPAIAKTRPRTAPASSVATHEAVDPLPAGSLEMFVGHVQPIFMNRCATGGCHGPAAENRLRLERISAGRPASRRITERNLRSTRSLINPNDPAKSPLLTAPMGWHGGLSKPLFSDLELAQYKKLVAWVDHVAGGKRPAADREPAGREAEPPATGSEPAAAALAGVKPEAVREPVRELVSEPPRKPLLRAERESVSSPPPGASDPFDPEIFNRKYAPRAARSE